MCALELGELGGKLLFELLVGVNGMDGIHGIGGINGMVLRE